LNTIARIRVALAGLVALSLVACGGGGGGGSTPPVTSTSSPAGSNTYSPSPNSATAYTCPSSDTELAVQRGGESSTEATRHPVRRLTAPAPSNTIVEVAYRTAMVSNPVSAIDARVSAFGGVKLGDVRYATTGYAVRTLRVAPSSFASAEAALREAPGVVAVGAAQRARTLSVNQQYLGTDPYFVGYTGTSAPLYQTSATGGQWDMHIVGLGDAFDYSQSANGSTVTNANATGSQNVKLAIIDTGEDVTHPELKLAHIVRTECFITNESGVQSTGTFVTDGDGHGTDVTGIAEASPTNDYGFVGDAGNVSLMLYRVFPTPDDNCTNDTTTDPQCSATDADIASAIDDAVANGANVISMSLGGGTCGSGSGYASDGDPSLAEGAAVANAIANNVIVVAAAGNAGSQGVDSPGCDSQVIAAGASAYNDGTPNGTNANPGSTPTEYVAGYSQWGATNTADSTSSWGIVAPGGDPSAAESSPNATTIDYLHWVENIWTSTPYMSSSTDVNFEGNCNPSTDYPQDIGDCRTLIAGTSMATPHVAGAAALILSVNSAYKSPSKMFQLLCQNAHDIGDPHEGCGRLDVYRAMAVALGDGSLPSL
jgi:subtilisin family serine protease